MVVEDLNVEWLSKERGAAKPKVHGFAAALRNDYACGRDGMDTTAWERAWRAPPEAKSVADNAGSDPVCGMSLQATEKSGVTIWILCRRRDSDLDRLLITNNLLIPLGRTKRRTLGLPKIWAHNRHTACGFRLPKFRRTKYEMVGFRMWIVIAIGVCH